MVQRASETKTFIMIQILRQLKEPYPPSRTSLKINIAAAITTLNAIYTEIDSKQKNALVNAEQFMRWMPSNGANTAIYAQRGTQGQAHDQVLRHQLHIVQSQLAFRRQQVACVLFEEVGDAEEYNADADGVLQQFATDAAMSDVWVYVNARL